MPLDVRAATSPVEADRMTPAELRGRMVVDDLFAPGQVRLVMTHQDRILLGGAVPSQETLELVAPAELRSQHLCERRELGVVCLAGAGVVTTGTDQFQLRAEDVLYVGQGTERIVLSGPGAIFYLVSAPAHRAYPTTLARRDDAESMEVGDPGLASRRTIRKYVHEGGVQSCQLALGITTLAPGSVWNTMPCHLHDRRTEVYLYFNLPEDARVVHLCGRPESTRSLILADRQAVISPPWSIHTGAGTSPYRFVWSTAGENLTYNDMDMVDTRWLR